MCREFSKCYKDVNVCLWNNGSDVTQSVAQSICEQRNSFLPRVTNSNIQSKLTEFRSVAWPAHTGGIWIDVKAVDPNDFHWIDGSSLAGHFHFFLSDAVHNSIRQNVQESWAIAKMTARCALYMGACPENFPESLSTPTVTFPEIFNGLLFRAILWMCVQNLKFIALSFHEIIGGTPKYWAVPEYAYAPLSPKFLWSFARFEPANVPVKFEVHSFKRSWDNWRHRINLGSPCIRPRSIFSIIFSGLLSAFGLRRAKVLG